MKKKTKIAFIVIIITVLFLIMCIIYFRPRHYRGSYTACSLEGDTVSVEFDVTLHKRLWNGDKLTGSIFVDGKEYVSLWDIFGYFSDNAEGFRSKTRFEFWQSAGYALESHSDSIILDLYEKGRFDNFKITTLKILEDLSDPLNLPQGDLETDMQVYYGPAASQDEAEDIISECGY